jgi:hypothetical protein
MFCIADCGNPTPANGYANLTFGTTFGSTVTVTCNSGYNLTGDSLIVCQQSGWSDTPSCVIQGQNILLIEDLSFNP